MPNRLVGVYPERITVPATGLAGHKLWVYQNRTLTQAALVNGDGEAIAQPLLSNAAGEFETHPYSEGGGPFTVLITDGDDNPLPGFPKDDIPAAGGSLGTAAGIPFDPTDRVPETTVQAAIERVASLAVAQSDMVQRALTPWPTGGTGNAYTLTPTPALTAYTAGMPLTIRPNRANTGAATVNVNGVGVRNLHRINENGAAVALTGGELVPHNDYLIVDDGVRFVITDGVMSLRASGSNGVAIRFADGTMICTAGLSFDALPIATGFMGGFRSVVQEWTYQTPFVGTPNVTGVPRTLSAFGLVVNAVGDTGASFLFTAVTSQAAATRVAHLIAVGRWR